MLVKLIDFDWVRTTVGKEPVPLIGVPLPSQVEAEDMEVLGTSYFIAPEVLERNYDERCDMWSLGTILYLMLTGVPPFNGADDDEILAKVRQGKYSIETLIDAGASDDAMDFITKLMEFDKSKRLTAEQAQSHPWILKNVRKEKAKETTTNDALANLRGFKMSKQL